jgi:hypothetical protein
MTTETTTPKTTKITKPVTEEPTKEVAIQLLQPGVPAQRIETFREGGADHPIMASDRQIVGTFYMAGERPVVASELVISDYFMAMGNKRPVASNQIDDAPTLMGFLD